MSDSSPLLDVNGRRITATDLNQAMRTNILAGCLGMVWVSMSISMPLTMFLEAAGAGGTLIGLATTMRLLALNAQIPGAFFAERLRSRKKFWAVTSLIHRGLWLGVALLAWFARPGEVWVIVWTIVLVTISDVLAQLGASSWFSWMAELIPQKTSGRFWGMRQSVVTAVSIVGMFAAGFMLDAFRHPETAQVAMKGFAVVFAIGALFGMADVLVHLKVKEPTPTPNEHGRSLLQRLMAPLKVRDFRQLTIAMGVWSFAVAMFGSFTMIYLKRYFPVSYSHLAAIAVAGSLGAVATSPLFGKLIDKLGARTFCALLFIFAPFTVLSWLFINYDLVHIGPLNVPQVIVVQCVASFLGGSLFSAVALCQMRLMGALSPSTGRTMAMAMHWCLIGLLASLGPLVGGTIMDWVEGHPLVWHLPTGIEAAFLHILAILFVIIVWFVALPLLLTIRKRSNEVEIGAAVSHIVLNNPLQVVRNFYNMQIMAAQSSSHDKARAARKLGIQRTPVAVPDLIEKLDDPSIEVQEEAIEALGTIATRPAVEALVAKLEDPVHDLDSHIARALRHAADPAAVGSLLHKLESADRETVAESARALGAIGDTRATPALLKLIQNASDPKIIAATGEALAALGELDAAWQMIAQMRSLPNRMLKRALAVAVGDLLGERDDFYKILGMESEAHGAGCAIIEKRLLRALRLKLDSEHPLLARARGWSGYYDDGEIQTCAALLLSLCVDTASALHNLPIGISAEDAMEHLFEKHPRDALSIWYLRGLNEPWEVGGNDARENFDMLLGAYLNLHVAETSRS